MLSLYCRYTLRNAEYRLCLERNLDIHEGSNEVIKTEDSKLEERRMLLDIETAVEQSIKDEMPKSEHIGDNISESIAIEGLGEITSEAQQYILNLQSHLSSIKEVNDNVHLFFDNSVSGPRTDNNGIYYMGPLNLLNYLTFIL